MKKYLDSFQQWRHQEYVWRRGDLLAYHLVLPNPAKVNRKPNSVNKSISPDPSRRKIWEFTPDKLQPAMYFLKTKGLENALWGKSSYNVSYNHVTSRPVKENRYISS
jgi:hypothetical protein